MHRIITVLAFHLVWQKKLSKEGNNSNCNTITQQSKQCGSPPSTEVTLLSPARFSGLP